MKLAAAGSTDITDHAPDWAAMTGEILCPLCDYNLRGLVEPRCPECGHQSTWTDLVDPARRGHPWLFEHQNKRRIQAFFKAYFISQFPGRFWRSVRPNHVPHIRRLIGYWLLTLMFALPVMMYEPARQIGHTYHSIYQERQRVISINSGSNGTSNPLNPWVAASIQSSGGLQNYLDNFYPYPSLLQVIDNRYNRESRTTEVLLAVGIGAILWPWITVLSLLVFRATLRQARIKLSHVVRCAIYSSDVALLLALPLVLLIRWRIESVRRYEYRSMWAGNIFEPGTFVLLMTCVLVLMYRLWVAYRQYLEFPHAFATCVASQCMTVLTLLLIYLCIAPY